MASKIKVDQILGSTGSTITVPTGQTLTLTDGLAVASLPTVTVAKGGTNLTSFAAGDTLYATGSTTLAKLTKGSAADVLTMNSGATAPEWAAAAGGGKIGQVLSSSKTDTQSFTSTTYTDVTDLSIAITPAATSSKIWWSFSVIGSSTSNICSVRIVYGDGTALTTQAIGDADGSRQRSTAGSFYAGDGSTAETATVSGLDAPNTTSATTYKIQWYQGSGTGYTNRTVLNTDSITYQRGMGSITVMEVLA